MSRWGSFVPPLARCKNGKYYIFRVCVFSLRYQACKAHVPCCQLWPIRLYSTFPHYLTKGKIFANKEMLLNLKFTYWFFLQLLSETILVLFAKLRKATISFMSIRLSVRNNSAPTGRIYMKFESFWKSVEKFANFIKIRQEQGVFYMKTRQLVNKLLGHSCEMLVLLFSTPFPRIYLFITTFITELPMLLISQAT